MRNFLCKVGVCHRQWLLVLVVKLLDYLPRFHVIFGGRECVYIEKIVLPAQIDKSVIESENVAICRLTASRIPLWEEVLRLVNAFRAGHF